MKFDCQTMPRHIVDMFFVEIAGRLKDVFALSQEIISVYGGWSDDPQP